MLLKPHAKAMGLRIKIRVNALIPSFQNTSFFKHKGAKETKVYGVAHEFSKHNLIVCLRKGRFFLSFLQKIPHFANDIDSFIIIGGN